MSSSELKAVCVDIWTLTVADEVPAETVANCRLLLSTDELARGDRFRIAKKRTEFTIAHAYVRRVLSHYRSVTPADWRFAVGSLGRPEVANAEADTLRFNLSHTEGLIACAVAEQVDVGVDVEMSARPIDLGIADRYFSSLELTQLQSLVPGERHRRFFELWTLKEAYLKARGAGLHLPLDAFSIVFNGPAPTGIEFNRQRIDSEPSDWRIFQKWLGDDHVAACVVKAPAAVNCRFTIRPMQVSDLI